MIITLIYTISMDGLPFRKDLFTLLKFPKESNWISAILWVILLACFVWQNGFFTFQHKILFSCSLKQLAIWASPTYFSDR